MSDVERIVNANHDRVRWAAEYEGERIATSATHPRNDRIGTDCHGPDGPRNDSGERIATAPAGPRNDNSCRRVYRSTALGCAMFAGGASAFVGIGLSMGRWLTVAVGMLVAVLFLACGSWAERLAEKDAS